MRILLLGDASNYHFSLSQGLARMGHDVTVASHGSRWMQTGRDLDISRGKGKLAGAWLWVKLRTLMARDLRGYDIVQLSNPIFVDLMPQRVRKIFDDVRRHNGHVFLTLLGTDTPYVRMATGQGRGASCSPKEGGAIQKNPLRYTEWAVDGHPTPYALANQRIKDDWLAPLLRGHCDYIYENINGAVAALYEYFLAGQMMLPAEKLAYGGIPVECPGVGEPWVASHEAGLPIRIMCACHKGREAEKGIDLMLPVLKDLERENPGKVQIDFVQNVPLEVFKQSMDRADIIVDQLYAYSPSTTPLMAMAQGKVVVSGGEEQFYDFIGEPALRPIINPDPADLEGFRRRMQEIIERPCIISDLSRQGREFVAKHNSQEVVAQRFMEFWERRIG